MTKQDNKALFGGAVFFGAVVLNILSSVAYSAVHYANGNSYGGAFAVWAYIISYSVHLLTLPLIILCSKACGAKPDFRLTKPTGFSVVAAVISAAAALIGFYLISSLFAYGLGGLGYKTSPIVPVDDAVDRILVSIRAVLLAPVCEELLFRGGALTGLNRLCGERRRGYWMKVLLCGGMFMLLHMSPAQTVYQFLFGCVLTMLVLASGSVIPAVIAHALSNIVVLTLEFTAGTALTGAIDGFFTALPALFIIVAVTLAAGAFTGLYFLMRKLQKKTEGRGIIMLPAARTEAAEGRLRLYGILLYVAGALICITVWIAQLAGGMSGAGT